MATEVCCTSPRFSFSAAVDGRHTDASIPLDSAPKYDFNFNIGGQICSDQTPSADELFSNGKILPLFHTPSAAVPVPVPASTPPPPASDPAPAPAVVDRRNSLRDLIDSSAAEPDARYTSRLSIWRFHRSSSVGEVNDPRSHLNPFYLYRSRSTGSFPVASPIPKQVRQTASDWSQRKTYYYSGSQNGSVSRGTGVRISPVLNVPAPVVSRGSSGRSSGTGAGATTGGLFAYLLCNCGGGDVEDEVGVGWRNQEEQVKGKK